MNEEQKNIETCLPEDILAEVAGVPTDAHFRSLVNEALDPLKQQALPPAGYEAYEKVVWSHRPYTFTSSVRQMKSNLILLLRRLWRFPFGRGSLRSLSDTGSLRSLADMWSHYIDRLQGNATYGIPSRLDQLTDLPSAPLLLSDRKISGAPQAPDGMSVVRLVSSIVANDVKALTDTNTDWTMTSNPLSLFPNTETFQAYCKAIAFSVELNQTMFSNSHVKNLDMALVETITQTGGHQAYHAIFSLSALETVNLRKLKSYNGCLFRGGKCSEELWLDELTNAGTCIAQGVSGLKRLYAPKVTTCNGYSYHPNLIANNPDLEYAYIPELANYTVYGADDGAGSLQDMPKLEHLVIGRAPFISSSTPVRYALDNCPSLVLLDIRGGLNVNLYLDHLDPTDKGATFLSNFKAYIAERLADNGAGKTLTLSQAVRNAIHAAESTYGIENIIITQKGWTISPAPN